MCRSNLKGQDYSKKIILGGQMLVALCCLQTCKGKKLSLPFLVQLIRLPSQPCAFEDKNTEKWDNKIQKLMKV
jgi:hypothetical protein